MKLPRRKFLHLAAGAAALPAVSRTAQAQAYPTRPVRVVVGAPPGSSPDILARLSGQWCSERLSSVPGPSGLTSKAIVVAPTQTRSPHTLRIRKFKEER